jgi:beta-lactamase regulating signal transducer with metallopeptidase domain
MERIYSFIPRELIEAMGWTIFHSLWQGVIIALILGLILLALIKNSAHIRYIINMLALGLMVASTSVTFVKEYANATERAEIRKSIITNPSLVVQHFKEEIKNIKSINKPSSKTQFELKWILFKVKFQKYFPWVVSLWMAGIILLILRFLGGMIVVQRLKYRQTIPLDEIWLEKIMIFTEQLKISQPVKVLQSCLIQVPATLGFFKPVILLPVSLLTGLSAAQVESIIAHELAHIARRDYLFNIFQSVVEILFFYHPVIWWISSIARAERENCCDDIAIDLTGDKISYAKALANIRVETPPTSYAMAFSNNNNKLLKRVKRLLNPHTMKTNFKEGFIASCVLFTGILMLTIGASASVKEYNISPVSKDTIKSQEQSSKNISGSNTKSSKENKEITEKNDKMLSDLKGLENMSDGLEKELEVALGDMDNLSTYEVLKGIKGALNEMDINIIVNEALKGAKAAINNMDIDKVVNESLKKNEESNKEVIAHEAINGAQAALKEMDLNVIVNEALKGAEGALKEMDIEKIIEESIEKDIQKEAKKDKKDALKKENKYLPIIQKGSASWNNFRKENQQILPDLSNTEISELNLEGINLKNISLEDACIQKSNLNNGDLTGIFANNLEIRNLQLNNADFSNSTLSNAEFKNSTVQNTSFKNANLQSAELTDCNFSNCDFRKANLRDVQFSGGSLNNCEFKGAIANEDTQFPAGFNAIKEGIIMEK